MHKHIKLFFISILISLFFLSAIFSQSNRNNVGNAIGLNLSYGVHVPGGDLSSRFGTNFSISSSLEYLIDRNNLIIGVEFNFLFGNNVEEDVIASLRNKDGLLIGTNGQITDVFLRERGLFYGLALGKLFTIIPTNPKSGIRLSISPGVLQHKIRIQDDSNSILQLQGEYAKGYDRLSRGFALKQLIGYQHLSNDGRINFFLGFDFIQGFTKNQRPINFDTGIIEQSSRNDFLWGIRATWVLPIYFGKVKEERFF